jgi:hypothetical protein
MASSDDETKRDIVLAPAERDDIHLVVKWSARYGADTDVRHKAMADQHGAVWWGLFTSSDPEWRVSQHWIDQLREEIAGSRACVFIAGPTCWRTRLLDVQYERDKVDPNLVPGYYESDGHYELWVKLADFKPIDRNELYGLLDPAAKPGRPVALGNQTNPLIVRVRTSPRVWWVNQGASYQRAREGRFLWAPTVDKAGRTPKHWRTMLHLRPGDLVLNYAGTQLRAKSEVVSEAIPASRPDPEADQSWSNEGFRVELRWHDLPQPVALNEIPMEWRTRERGPFDKTGAVNQGYLFPLSDEFAAKLASHFPATRPRHERRPLPEDAKPYGSFDLETLQDRVAERQLRIAPDILANVLAALGSGKHLILTGPPGTAKTTLAEIVAAVAADAGLCSGYTLTTATADWTTYETIGGLKPDTKAGLSFQEGHFLEAVRRQQWLVIDELNRSNFDRAFGQLFTVLSGQAVELPYERVDRAHERSSDSPRRSVADTFRTYVSMLGDLELKGRWFLPDVPEKQTAGTLTFSQADGASLQLLGQLGSQADVDPMLPVARILGHTSAGEAVTLEDCAASGFKLATPGFPTSVYRPSLVLVGAHFAEREEVLFEELRFTFNHLENWVATSGFEFEFFPPDGPGIDIQYRRPTPVEAALPDGVILKFDFGFSVSSITQVVTDMHVTQSAALRLSFGAPVSFDRATSYAYQLRNFVGLAVGAPVQLRSFDGYATPTDAAAKPGDPKLKISVLYKLYPPPDEFKREIHPFQMLFTLDDARPRLEQILTNWFVKQDRLKPVFDLYFGTIYNKHLYLEQAFLSLIQALESYHRRTSPASQLPASQHAQRLSAVIASSPPEHREWLERQLAYSNELTLRQRLQKLLVACPNVLSKLIPNKKDFIHRTHTARNYLTHYDEQLQANAPQGSDLYPLVVRLRTLTEMCILLELGFDCLELDRIFERVGRYREASSTDAPA